MELQTFLKRQMHFSWWLFGLFIAIIIGIALIASGQTSTVESNGMYHEEYSSGGQFGIAIVSICWTAFIVLWILSIINTARINSITKESTSLVVFASLSFMPVFSIVLLILTYTNKHKFDVVSGTQSIDLRIRTEPKYHPADNSIETQKAKLRQAFIDGAISLKEYESKIKVIEAQETKQP